MLSTVKKLEFVTNELCIFCIFNRSAHDGRLSKAAHKTPNRGCSNIINKYCLIHYKLDYDFNSV